VTVQRRTVVKGVRLTRAERAAIQRAADSAGLGVGDFMRVRLLKDLEIRGEQAAAPRQALLPWEDVEKP